MFEQNDTICAVATPTGGALTIIRISGQNALKAAEMAFKPKSGPALSERPPYSAAFGTISTPDGSILDEAVATVFRAPHSYTGEDSVEFSCHGSAYIAQRVMSLLVMNGCRQALPGEFTQRAFLSGKLDLSQAEAVADLIASTSAASHRLAMNQMKGGFSRKLRSLRNQLLELTTLMELELDFSEEDVNFADRTRLDAIAADIETTLTTLSDSFKAGNAIRNGIPVAIIGRTNTGKSTLLNLLLDDDRALVSDVRGTTRDSIEDTTTISGIQFRFIDTAGIRQSDDAVEQMGIERSFQKVSQADIVLWLMDCTQPDTIHDSELEERLLPLCNGRTLIRILNKCDLQNNLATASDNSIYMSAKQGLNIDILKQQLVDAAPKFSTGGDEIVVTNIRHYEAINRALDCITRARRSLSDGTPTDLISQDTREAIYHLSDILGEVTTDQVLQNIFSHFCIGK